MIDYEALARRSLDVSPSSEARAALRVWADQLEAAGDPRGTLIALEHAQHAEPHRHRELHKAALDHALAHAAALLGPLEDLARRPRAVELTWRAGQLYRVKLDIRRAPAPLGTAEYVARVLAAPITAGLRGLAVRTRGAAQTADVLAHILDLAHAPPLEELTVSAGGPRYPRLSSSWPPSAPRPDRLLTRYPDLRVFASSFTCAWPTRLPGTEVEHRIQAVGLAEPETPAGRAMLGRSLLSIEPILRDAALRRIEQVGPRAAGLVDTLMCLLLAASSPKLPVALALATLGDAGRSAVPILAAITGRLGYSVEIRRAAGVALAALRGAVVRSPAL